MPDPNEEVASNIPPLVAVAKLDSKVCMLLDPSLAPHPNLNIVNDHLMHLPCKLPSVDIHSYTSNQQLSWVSVMLAMDSCAWCGSLWLKTHGLSPPCHIMPSKWVGLPQAPNYHMLSFVLSQWRLCASSYACVLTRVLIAPFVYVDDISNTTQGNI